MYTVLKDTGAVMTLIKQILFRTPYIDYAEAHSVEYICFMLKKPSPLPQEFKMVSKVQRNFFIY